MSLTSKYTLLIATVAAVFFGSASAQTFKVVYQTPGITQLSFSSVQGSTLQGNYYLRVSYTGSTTADSVVLKLAGLDLPFNTIKLFDRGSPTSTAQGLFSLWAWHKDTLVRTGTALIFGDSLWRQPRYEPGTTVWSGTLSRVDAIALVLLFDRDIPPGTVVVHFDGISVFTGGQDSVFYDGGEMGLVSGTVFNDADQSGFRNEGELGLASFKVYLASETHLDSVLSDSSGDYRFDELARDTYIVSLENRGGWTIPLPETLVVGDVLNHVGVDFGLYSPTAIEYHYPVGWQIVGLPQASPDSSVLSLYGFTASAFSYGPLGYEPTSVLARGRGYWLRFPFARTVVVVGDSLTDITIDLTAGWNLIGGVTRPVPVAEVTSDPPGMVTSSFFGYNGNYFRATTIEAGKGYWVKVNQSGKLMLSSNSSAPASARIVIAITSDLPPSPPEEEPKIEHQTSNIPKHFTLEQNYPNPFNPTTEIRFEVPVSGFVSLKVYDVLGREVATLIDGMRDEGFGSVHLDASRLPTGVYTYRLVAGGDSHVRKMVLTR